MRRIAIVGAGQSGLQLALGLQKHGYEVTVVSSRTAQQIRNGRVSSSQFMFHNSLQIERDLGINFWEKECPITEGIAFSVPGPDGGRALFWEAKLDHYGQSVDQRLKFAGWLEEFARRGGKVVHKEAAAQDLEDCAKSNDLVLVAAGKAEISQLFPVVSARCGQVAIRQAHAGSGADVHYEDRSAQAVHCGFVQLDPGSRGILRVPCVDGQRAVRNHGL